MPVAPLNSGRACGDWMITRRNKTPPDVDAGGVLISDSRWRRAGPATMGIGVTIFILG
jgi:hypothetical protein